MTAVDTIANDAHSGILQITWRDGRQQRWEAAFLRTQCQCAACKAHRRQSGEALKASPALRITDIRMVGAYGVQFIFSDGHDRGIFPWTYLHELAERPSHNIEDHRNV
jgi:DUF971 family protein